MMVWKSFEDFLAMGGYAGYVWGSYIVTAVFMIVEPIVVKRRHRRAVDEAKQRLAEEEVQ